MLRAVLFPDWAKASPAASLGRLLKSRGYKVASQKLDPYINIDPGTMSPYQHGEVFVTDDGAETDLDLGHYERFIDENLNKFSNLTTGKVYWNVLNKERNGEYLGQTVQVIPHITGEIKSFIYNVGAQSNADIVITEIGGTIGDIESQPFIEAIRQVSMEAGRGNCCFIHVTLVPYISGSCEFKSKPTQHSVKELQGMGITPDIIVARVDAPLPEEIKRKIAMFCNVGSDCVIENRTLPLLYEAPIMLERENLSSIVCRILGLPENKIDLSGWTEMLRRAENCEDTVRIALCGKYVQLHDAYLSVAEALAHAGFENSAKVEIEWVDSEVLNEENTARILDGVDGVLVPGGFGGRGVEGKICAVKYAREHHVPFLGICLGMQVAVIEFARHVLGYADAKLFRVRPRRGTFCHRHHARSAGRQNGRHHASGRLSLRGEKGQQKCTMPTRRAAFPNAIATVSSSTTITARRWRKRDCVSAARRRTGRLVEAVELPDEDFFVGVQFHPEFKIQAECGASALPRIHCRSAAL